MSFNINNVLPERTIYKYNNMLSNISLKNKEDLIRLLLEIKNYGVESIAFRQIDKNGYSNIFSTHKKWEMINDDEQFQKLMREHVNNELMRIKQSNFSYVTRSADKLNNQYLQILHEFDLNNSIIKHKFYEDKIEITYFMFNDVNRRDIILNNLDNLNLVLGTTNNLCEYITNSEDFIKGKKILLSENSINYIWRQNDLLKKRNNKFNVDFHGQSIELTKNELKCLILCGKCVSNKAISLELGKSPSTVKDYITKLKSKFKVVNRDQLVNITQQDNMKYFNSLEI